MIYGYCRISTTKQNIERQVRNILAAFPGAQIYKEAFTGTKVEGRKEMGRILKQVKANDTIVFDSVSRMSRNAEEGFELYEQLFNKSVRLCFLKEPHVNTDTYRSAMENILQITFSSGDPDMDQFMTAIVDAINNYILSLAKKQIYLAFEQAEKEVTDLRQRTIEGIETARRNGKIPGRRNGQNVTTQKSVHAKIQILKYSKTFGGTMDNKSLMRLAGIAEGTLLKYKRELLADLKDNDCDIDVLLENLKHMQEIKKRYQSKN